MCDMCDGYGVDQLFSEFRKRVREHGYTMVNVEGSPPWTYTIGLSDGFDHPSS